MITLRPYKDSDWKAITDAVEPFSPLLPSDSFMDISKRSVAVTGVEDGEIMACGGITFTTNEEGLVWVKVSTKCGQNGYTWARAIREVFTALMDSIAELQVSTYVVDNFCKGDRLAKMIGLKNTGKFQEYKGNKYYKYTAVT